MIKFLPLLIIMLSCKTTEPMEVLDNSYEVIYKSEMGGTEKAGHILIKNNESYIRFIDDLKLDESEYSKFVRVDFKKKDILILYQGQKNSGGYGIDIEMLKNDNQTILIKKKEIGPKKGEMTTSVITSPFCIVIIPKGNQLIIE